MFFIVLTFIAALFIEGLGSLVSVIGISALFGANPIIIALAIALDLGKVVTVSLLYTYWKSLSKIMKSYALLAATVTMIITSAGAAGYLSGEFQKAIMGTKEGELKVSVLKEQQAKYQARKAQIDDQIAKLPEKTTVNQRLRLMNGFKAEQKALDEKISQIDKDLPNLQVKQIGTEAKAGPILAIAKSFNVTVEEAVKWVIGLIIFVFDPLAIFLIIAGNFLWARRKAGLTTPDAVEVHEPVQEQIQPEPEIVAEPALFPTGPDLPLTGNKGDMFFHTRIAQMFIHDGERWVQANTLAAEKELVPETTYTTLRQEYVPDPEKPVSVPFPIEEPVELKKELELEPIEEPVEKQVNRSTYIPTGILKPVTVEADDDENNLDKDNFIPLHVETPVPEEKPLVDAGPVLDTPPPREEITRSTLGYVTPDPHTVVDAHHTLGFRKTTVATPTKQ